MDLHPTRQRFIGLLVAGMVVLPTITFAQTSKLLRASTRNELFFDGFVESRAYPNSLALALTIVDKQSEDRKTLLLDAPFRRMPPEALAAGIAGDRAVVTGARSHGDQIVIFSLKEPVHTLKSFGCLRPEISNDGSKVAYASAPTRFTVQTHTLVLSIIDLLSDALEPVVIYPRENAIRQVGQPWVDDARERRVLLSPLSWRKDDQQVAFFERHGDRDDFYLVVLDLSQGASKVAVSRQKVDVRALAHSGRKNQPERLPFVVKTVTWADDTMILASLEHAEYWKTPRVTIRITTTANGGE